MAQSLDALAQKHGGAVAGGSSAPDLDALAAKHGAAPASPPASSAPLDVGDHALDFLRGAWKNLNPMGVVRTVGSAVTDPIGTAKGIGLAQGQLKQKADESFAKGDYITGARHMINWLLPLVGPALDASGDQMAAGRYGEGAGEAVGLGLATLAPMVKSGPRVPRPQNQVMSKAAQFGTSRGIPIDAATATDSRIVGSLQKRATDTIGGAGVAETFKAGQDAALARVGSEIADTVHPTPIMPEQAGQGVRDAVTKKAEGYNAVANVSYDRLRKLEERSAARIAQTGGWQAPTGSPTPFTAVPLAVDVSSTTAAMKPIYESLKREAELVPLQGDKARALTTLDRLMSAPDTAPLSVADAALGDIKAVARSDQAFSRTAGQGVAAEAVKNLEASVMRTARQAGPDVVNALISGRAATVNKYKAIDVLDKLRTEPVQVFNQATYAKDAGIAQLRDVARLAPQEMPKIARAYLDDLLAKATSEGRFDHAQALSASWQKLGPATKQILFKDPAHVRELDQFFRLAKKIAENPNPSGTARVLTAANLTASIPAYAVAKLLYSPAGVRLLTRGIHLPRVATVAAKAWRAEVANVIGRDVLVGVPATADQERAAGVSR